MYRHINALILISSLAFRALSCSDSNMVDGFDNIEPSANLTWRPCFRDFTCSKLEVPLDYANQSFGTTSIAFIKLAGKNATAESPSIIINPGGPGNSGVDLILSNQALASQLFGEQYNLVSFDPRGVNNSGPNLNCFSGNPEARLSFRRLHNTGITNLSSISLEDQYFSSSMYGEWCNDVVEKDSPHGYYVTTPAVAQDLLTFIEAEARMIGKTPSSAKLWNYGVSYGTVVGTTFASMFPERVGRMVLDGVVNADLYYNNDYSVNIIQADEAMSKFSSLCHSAGPDTCSFWGPSPENITTRLDNLVHQLQNHAISNAQSRGIPKMVTYSDLKAVFLTSLYTPIASFPTMAGILHQIEHGNVSALAGKFEESIVPGDANHVINCADAYRRNKLTSIEEFKGYVEDTASKSKYIGDIYPIFVDTVLCRAFRPQLPDNMTFQGPIGGLGKKTAFPILFTSNTIDPITPLISAYKMFSRFPGSVVLVQEAIGHTVLGQGASNCYFEHVKAYFHGKVPSFNTTCRQQHIPFMNDSFAKLLK